MNIPDNYSQWQAHQRQQERLLDKLPKCDYCKKTIQDEDLYEIGCLIVCPDCLDKHYKRKTEDFMN